MARGHVRQRGKGWVYVLRHAALDKPEWSRQVATRAEAERALTARLAQLDLGQGVHASKDTLAGYVRAWLAGRTRITAATRLNYRREVERRIVPGLGDVRLATLTPERVAAWHGWMRGQGVSEKGIVYAHGVLTIALRQAVAWGHIPTNPAALVERPRVERVAVVCWEPDEAQRFLLACDGLEEAALYRVALAGLLRRGELLALTWDDVDLARRRIHVRRTITRSGIAGDPWTTGVPKGKRSRVVVVDEETSAALARHKERQVFQRARSSCWVEEGLVFPNRDGGPMQFETLRLRFLHAVEQAGVRQVRFHDLRHTGATLLLRGGVPLKVVSEMLGHASFTMTATLYLHVSETMQDEASQVMGQMLKGTGDASTG